VGNRVREASGLGSQVSGVIMHPVIIAVGKQGTLYVSAGVVGVTQRTQHQGKRNQKPPVVTVTAHRRAVAYNRVASPAACNVKLRHGEKRLLVIRLHLENLVNNGRSFVKPA